MNSYNCNNNCEVAMVQHYFTLISRVSIFALLGTFLFAQRLDIQDIAYNELRPIVETASRSQQTVWVEDFTGCLWPYCPSVSFALDTLLNEFPETLMTIEWHSANYTSRSSDFDLPEVYSARGQLYGVGYIPHTQWNGVLSFVGGGSNSV